MEKWTESKWLYRLLLAILVMTLLFLLMKMSPWIQVIRAFISHVFGPFLIAMVISYLLNPIVNVLSQRKVPRSIAVLLIYSLFILSFVILMMNLYPLLERQLFEMIEHLPDWNRKMQSLIQEYHDHSDDVLPYGIKHGIEQALTKIETGLGNLVANWINSIGSTLNQLFIAIVIPFLAFYMMKDAKDIEKYLISWLPKENRGEWLRLFRNIDQALGNYVRGQFLVCLVVGILAYIGYEVIGLPYPLLLASSVALFNIVPYLGPFIGALPALFVALTISLKMLIGVIIVNLLVQLLEGNVISPQIVGRSLHLHPLAIIFALLVGEEIAGILGLILAVPVLAVGKVIFEHIITYYIDKRTA